MTNIDVPEGFLSKYHIKHSDQSLKQFFTYEYYFLSGNTSLNPIKFQGNYRLYISSVDNYFTFPMIFMRSVFHALDINKKNFVTINEYIEGFLTIYSGNINARLMFIFKMFNLNQDDYIHKEDVSMILNYTHIFDNKKKQELLQSIIDDFFGNHTIYTAEKFINRIHKKNSGLFFIIMCIFFEHQNFNSQLLSIIEEEEKSGSISKSNGPNGKKNAQSQKHINFSSCSTKSGKLTNIDSINELEPPSNKVIEYIQLNYQIDLTFLRSGMGDARETLNDSNSSESDLNAIDEEDLMELSKFEKDLLEAKSFLVENAYYLNNFVIPRGGSNEFTLQSGQITSVFCSKIKNSSISSTRSFNINSMQKKNSCIKSSFAGGHFNSTSNVSLVHIPVKQDQMGSFYEYNSQTISNNEQTHESFSEEVIVIKKKNNTQKKYHLTLTKGFILIFKKKVGNVLTLDSIPVQSSLKDFIPLRHLYVVGIDDNVNLNQTVYHQLNLVSTSRYANKNYSFIFENKIRLNELVHLIVLQTKYVSISNEYSYVKDIGRGSFCQIKLMKHNKTNILYSVKKLKKQVTSLEEFTTLNWEKDIVIFLSHFPHLENIIKFYRIIESYEHIYIIMEYIPNGSLGNYIRKKQVCLPSTTVKEITRQMVNGIRYLHQYGIVHRDLKLENILMDCKDQNTFQVKVIDFGLSQVITPLAKTKETYGTLVYCSPEILLNLPYNCKVDVWSMGIIAYYLEYTIMPFKIKGREKEQQISNMIIMNELEIPKKIDKAGNEEEIKANAIMMSVIKNCLCKDINQRLSSEQIFHLFFQDDKIGEQKFR